MLGRSFALSIILGITVLLRSSHGEKAEDCVKGKQYWSESFLNPKGTCAPCPPHWKSCYNEPINDQKRCVDSCRVSPAKPTPKAEPTPPPTTLTPTPDRDKTSLVTVVYPTLANPNKAEINENTKPSHGGEEKGPETVIAISAFTIAFLALMTVLVLLVRRNRSTLAQRQDPEEAVGLSDLKSSNRDEVETSQEDHGEDILNRNGAIEEDGTFQIDALPVQATSSNSALWFDGMQDTENDKGTSSLTLSLLKESHV
ncbi:uncharacterized protein LOC114517321 [Dendronephthya gigantea]|uniref:uncharacterized protein LOC114517321 n=1 Tax=Dendronephthya gigantea TaxID=151771 RepID=UPI00106CD945|nr:uncharacterized protein LOC114517321 [Dendronephthya gigantea]